MKIKFSILIIVCLSIGVFITTLSYTKGQEINVSAAFSKLKSELSPLDLNTTATAQPPAGTDTYLKFYSLEFTDVQHSIGSIKSGKNTLAVQVFQPKDTKATVIDCAQSSDRDS